MLKHLSLQQLELLYTKKKRQQKYQSPELQLTATELQDFNNKRPEDTTLTFEEDGETQEQIESLNLLNEESVSYSYDNPQRRIMILMGMLLVQIFMIIITHMMGVYLFGSNLLSLLFCCISLLFFGKQTFLGNDHGQKKLQSMLPQIYVFVGATQIGMIVACAINFHNDEELIRNLVTFIPYTIMNIIYVYFAQKYKSIQ